MAALAPSREDILSSRALRWLEIASPTPAELRSFDENAVKRQILEASNYFSSHPPIANGEVWEKQIEQEFLAIAQRWECRASGWGEERDLILHAKADAWQKLRMLRTPLEQVPWHDVRVLCELRGQGEPPPTRSMFKLEVEYQESLATYYGSLALSAVQQSNAMSGTNIGPRVDVRAASVGVGMMDRLSRRPPICDSAGSERQDQFSRRWKTPKIIELASYRDFGNRTSFDVQTSETSDVVNSPAGQSVAPYVLKEPGARNLPRSDQKVVRLRLSAKVSSVPQPDYCSLAWSDAMTENMECLDRISRTLQDEKGGTRSKRHEKVLLQKYFETLGSPETGSTGRSGYPEYIEKRVNRFFWLEHAFEAGKAIYPKGYPVAFTRDEQQAFEGKLRAAGVPKDGIQQLIGSLRKFLKRRSKRPAQH